jgi:hypothetical protein
MGIGGWVVEAAIRFSSNGVQTMERIAASTNAAAIREAELTGKITTQEAAYMRLQNRMKSANAERMAFFTKASSGVALVGVAAIADAVVQASKLQRTLIAIKNETGAGNDAMEGFYRTIFKIANTMGVSPATAGDVMLNISRLTAGTMTTKQMQAIAPSIAGFASTINFNRPDVSVQDATEAGMQMAHLFRAYKPAALEKLLDKVYRLSGLMVENPKQAVRQMTYYEPLFKGLKIDDETSIAMMALLDRAGFKQKVGTNVRAMMLQELGPLQLTKHYEEGQGKILEHMGVFGPGMKFKWNLPGGGVDFLGMLQSVSQWAIKQERAGVPNSVVAKDIYGALGKQGGTIGLLMADPQMLGILGEIRGYLKNRAVSLAVGEANRQQSVAYQASRVWGNLQADLTELGYRATWASGSLKGVADTLHNWQEWLHQNRTAESWIGGTAAVVTVLAGIGATARITIPLLKFIGSGFLDVGKAAKLLAGDGGIGGVTKAANLARLALSPLAAIFASFAALKGLDFLRKAAIDSGQGKGFTDKYEAYLRGLHGPNAGSAPMFGDMQPAGGGMTPDQFRAHLRAQQSAGAHAPHRQKTARIVHVEKLSMIFPNAKNGPEVVAAVRDAFDHPLPALFSGGFKNRTHSRIPQSMTTHPV